eukprot:CAMPEP_0177688312 /NCGR_PEP_ID=MMETSP0447-20121125/34594_1 /TAXON_ID=0 /ORGANISM="Stygamoeba regulata, Strain BSH-02190019" /LENGTH=277 /DNA_ID=CAMNT_0019198611 /DNA_START=38 /DNA_END=868 /DNA_ORIENTATION=-
MDTLVDTLVNAASDQNFITFLGKADKKANSHLLFLKETHGVHDEAKLKGIVGPFLENGLWDAAIVSQLAECPTPHAMQSATTASANSLEPLHKDFLKQTAPKRRGIFGFLFRRASAKSLDRKSTSLTQDKLFVSLGEETKGRKRAHASFVLGQNVRTCDEEAAEATESSDMKKLREARAKMHQARRDSEKALYLGEKREQFPDMETEKSIPSAERKPRDSGCEFLEVSCIEDFPTDVQTMITKMKVDRGDLEANLGILIRVLNFNDQRRHSRKFRLK